MAISPDYVLSRDYEERVYAGVLGKIIGVYLGRPFEGRSNERIERELGEINFYVHEQRGHPLVTTDDDISGTFTFLRALAENGNDPNLTAAQIGDWWLNTLVEGRTILWWGGLGMSTEHTAYLRLKAGRKAPDSGSIAVNGKVMAEQVGGQIFIDGWGLVCPGDPEKAAALAHKAASVSHDGEAIYGAQVVAAMEAQAFGERDLNVLLDTAAGLIPKDSEIYRLMSDCREWAAAHCITDAVRETYSLVNMGLALAGQPPTAPKDGARFHFSLSGSVQGFISEDSPTARGTVTAENRCGALALNLHHLAPGRVARVATATFIPPGSLTMGGYDLISSPTLYPGQTIMASVEAGRDLFDSITVTLYVRVYSEKNALTIYRGEPKSLPPRGQAALTLTVPDTQGQPVAEVGIEVTSDAPVLGTVLLDRLTWDGIPTMTLGKAPGELWRRAWVNGVSVFDEWGSPERPYRVIRNEGTGLVTQGEYEWTGYTVSTTVLPHLARRLGLAGAVRGLRRYVALVLDEDKCIRLIEQRDDTQRVLAEANAVWQLEEAQTLSLTVTPSGITATVGDVTLTASGNDLPTRGAIGLLADTGYGEFGPVTVRPG